MTKSLLSGLRTALAAGCLLVVVSVAVPCLSAATLFPADDGMVFRDWSSGPYAEVFNAIPLVAAYHDEAARQSYRGLVIFDISGLWGRTLLDSTLHFYSFGFSGVELQYAAAPGPAITTASADAAGPAVATLSSGEGWQSFDVTPFLQSGIDSRAPNVGFILNAVTDGGGGMLASIEDPEGRGSYLEVSAVPEPGSMLLLALGLAGLALAGRFRQTLQAVRPVHIRECDRPDQPLRLGAARHRQ